MEKTTTLTFLSYADFITTLVYREADKVHLENGTRSKPVSGAPGSWCEYEDVTPDWCPLGSNAVKTVALVGCSARKLGRPAPARDLYTGVLFQYARTWVTGNGWPWHVLSAEHGLVDPDRVLEPYDTRFRQSAPSEWVDEVWQSLLERYDGRPVHFKLLAGLLYRVQLMRRIQDHPGWTAEAPLAGLGIGQQVAWLRERTVKARRYPGAPPACPNCGDASQSTKTYDLTFGRGVCLNCFHIVLDPNLINRWVQGDVSAYSVKTERGDCVTVYAVDMEHAERLIRAMELTPVHVQESPPCPNCGDIRQSTKTYDDAGLAACWNCKSAFEPGLIGQWVLGDVSSYAVETQGDDWVTVRAVDMDHAEKLARAMGLTPLCIQEAEEN